jgi:hypothetical protein
MFAIWPESLTSFRGDNANSLDFCHPQGIRLRDSDFRCAHCSVLRTTSRWKLYNTIQGISGNAAVTNPLTFGNHWGFIQIFSNISSISLITVRCSRSAPSDPLNISHPLDVAEKKIQSQFFGEWTDVLITVYIRCAVLWAKCRSLLLQMKHE